MQLSLKIMVNRRKIHCVAPSPTLIPAYQWATKNRV